MPLIRLSEWGLRPAGVASGIATKVGYGLATVVLLFTLSVAAQRLFVAAAPAPEAAVVEALSAKSTQSVEPPANPSRFAADGDRIDAATTRPVPSTVRRTSDAGRSEDAPAAAEPTPGWWSGVAALLAKLPFGPDPPADPALPATVAAGMGPVGTSSSSPTTGAQPSGGSARTISFGTSENTACEADGGSFDLNEVSDIYVCVAFKGLSGKYVEQLIFILPDGNVYQTMTVPFMTADMSLGSDPAVEFGGRQWQAARARQGADGETLVTARLPVAGTFITQYAMAGLWTVQVRLEGQPMTQDTFELVP